MKIQSVFFPLFCVVIAGSGMREWERKQQRKWKWRWEWKLGTSISHYTGWQNR